MKFLDKIALNRLISIITNFILSLIKIFQPHIKTEDTKNKRKRPVIDKLKNIFKNYE